VYIFGRLHFANTSEAFLFFFWCFCLYRSIYIYIYMDLHI